MKLRFFFAVLVLLLMACQLGTPTPTPTTVPDITITAPAAVTQSVVDTPLPFATKVPTSVPPTSPPATPASELAPFTVTLTNTFVISPVMTWQPAAYAGVDYPVPMNVSQAANTGVIANLTGAQQISLNNNGFIVLHSQEAQFGDLREKVSKLYGQPYFLTTDAAFHSLHITFDELLKGLEKEQFHPRIVAITQAALDEVNTYLTQVKGTSIENDTRLAAAYLAVALKLFDPQSSVEADLAGIVNPQVDQIMAGGGASPSVLIPNFKDDYGAYKPVGHYAGDPTLEAYFRGMTWFGRVNFILKSDDPTQIPTRVSLIITLAMRRATVEIGGTQTTAAAEWARLHETLSYLIGPSDDAGPVELAALMDQVYGRRLTIEDLGEDARWQEFLQHSGELPAPQINSTFVTSLNQLQNERSWRFMGQRFTLDGFVLQNLVFDKVGTREKPRKLPSGLDVMAAFGSDAAMLALQQAGETSYQNYPEQMRSLQGAVRAQPEAQWLNIFYNGWLYAFFPQLVGKDASFPTYMRTNAWAYKDVNSTLGSWAELKHDTALYTKMPEFAGGGGPPGSGPAPAYVEPNPLVFYRLAYVTRALYEGLNQFGFGGDSLEPPTEGDFTYPNGVGGFINKLESMANTFQKLGDYAVQELAGTPLTPDDWEVLQSCLGPVECQVEYMKEMYILTGGSTPTQEMPPVPVVAAVAGADESVLEVGVGGVDRIYVVIPIEGQMQIAQGGVFSYYEFQQPRANRLTDQQWRDRLASEAPAQPGWTSNFVSSGGSPADVLAFRIGDWYLITEAGDKLNVRTAASTSGNVLVQLKTGDYVQIVDGPVKASGYTWWKFSIDPYAQNPVEGWAVENQEWYARAWGQ